jgi:hypothetical protein
MCLLDGDDVGLVHDLPQVVELRRVHVEVAVQCWNETSGIPCSNTEGEGRQSMR